MTYGNTASENSLYNSLAGSYGDEDYYRSRDPYFQGGQSVFKWNMPEAQNSTQAFLFPFLQGLMGGALTGYGKKHADQTAYENYSANPWLQELAKQERADAPFGPLTEQQAKHDYTSGTKPIGWNTKIGQGDLALATLLARSKQEEATKRQELADQLQSKIDLATNPEVLAAQIKVKRAGRTGVGGYSAQTIDPEKKAAWVKKLDLSEDESSMIQTQGDLDRVMRAKGIAGEKVRPPSSQETEQLGVNDLFRDKVQSLKKQAETLDNNGLVNAIQGAKALTWFGKTDSPAYKFYIDLKDAQQMYARAREKGRLSDQDLKFWAPIFEGLPLLDSKKAIIERLNHLDQGMKKAKLNQINTLKKGAVNMSGFEEDRAALEKELSIDLSQYTPQQLAYAKRKGML